MMPERVPFRLNFWMTACAIPVLMLLIGLGVWQLQRLEWKKALIAERVDRGAAAPLAITEVPDDGWKDFEYRRVTLRGRFLHDREMLILNKVRHGQTGFDLVTPMKLADGGAVLIHRGWVPRAWPAGNLVQRRPRGIVTLTGVLRDGGKATTWVPDNDPPTNKWFFADVAQMAKAAGIAGQRPYLVRVTPDRREKGYPKGPHASYKISNKHLEYAITWFGLAATLVMIYLAYHVRRR
ncbi:MAG: SURF1 family protein [Rhodospirillaceae bacterium]|nr:MAG: SURF1 family protein [Rhodospirillaceae bacterium]